MAVDKRQDQLPVATDLADNDTVLGFNTSSFEDVQIPLSLLDARFGSSEDLTAEAERIRDVIAAALVAGTNVTVTPNDGANTITIAATGGVAVATYSAGWPARPAASLVFWVATDTAATAPVTATGDDIIILAQDADLSAIAALTTTSYGRAFLTLANLAALQAVLGTGTPSASTYLRGDGTWAVAGGTNDPLVADNVVSGRIFSR